MPCSVGHFFANDECLSCPIGTYQHFTGQTFCYICPKGKTTEGKDSISEYDCNSKYPLIRRTDKKKYSTDVHNFKTIDHSNTLIYWMFY